MIRFRVTAPPTDEPIDLKMVRDTHLRGIPDDSSENDYLRQLIRAAREYCENYTGLSLGTQTLEALPDRLEKTMTLPRPPIGWTRDGACSAFQTCRKMWKPLSLPTRLGHWSCPQRYSRRSCCWSVTGMITGRP